MNRYKPYEPHQNQLMPICCDDLFPCGSFERFLVDIIEKIDFDISDEEQDTGGETPYHPKALLGIIFYGYANGVFSSRKMERECRKDIGFMYVSGYNAPDHTTISRFISSQENRIEEIFTRILFLADESGYVDYKLIATDGSKIKADASSNFSGTMKMFIEREMKLLDKIKLAIKKQKATDKKVEKEYWEKKKKKYESNRAKIAAFLKATEEIMNYEGKEVQQNITAPDCRRMKAGMSIEESYNNQISVCGKRGIIIAADVSSNEIDVNLFTEMADKIKENVPARSAQKLISTHYLYDHGYYKIDNIVEADKRKMDVFIADRKDKCIYKKEDVPHEKIGIDLCQIKRCGDFFAVICPGGIKMTNCQEVQIKGKTYYSFAVKAEFAEQCLACRIYKKCRGENKYNKLKRFSIAKIALDNWELMDKYKKKMRTDRARRIYSNRISIVEKVFGHIKRNNGFRSFLRRGIEKVKNEWLIACCSYNIQKMYRIESR
ncbi:MAG: transposase [Candidatus Delongbacteria bacterium]|nr:transposase [Candidatus Delongbacteria bacterium]